MADITAPPIGALDVEGLYRRERDRIHAMCYAILRDQGDAEDAVQETFARVAARASTLHGDPTGYLVVVARNVCRDELRRRARRTPQDAAHRGDPTPEETAVQRGLLGFVWRHLARVEQMLLTDVFSGMSMAEIGERTGTSGDVAAQRVSRLRRRIRNLVAAPAALLVPVLRGSAAGRLMARLHPGSLVSPVIERLQTVEQAIAPVLVSIAAGAIAVPQHAVAVPPPVPAVSALAHATAAPHRTPVQVPAVAQALQTARAAAHALASPVADAVRKLHAVLPPDGDFQSFTPSPNFLHDHVLFATASTGECAHYPCNSVWRSDDAGATWKGVSTSSDISQAAGIALPPSWPADPTVFALDSSDIYRSDDGGVTFQQVFMSTSIGHAAIDPSSPPGNTRIVFDSGTGAPLVYTASDNHVHPLSGLPPGATATVMPMGGQVYLLVSGPAGARSLYTCAISAATCTQVGQDAFEQPLAVSPQFATDHTYFDAGYASVLVGTVESGWDSRTIAVPGMTVEAILPAPDYARSGVLDLVVQPAQYSSPMPPPSGLRLVNGVVQPWALQLPPGVSPQAIVRLPDGHLVAPAPMTMQSAGYTGGGVLCSSDDGVTWSIGC